MNHSVRVAVTNDTLTLSVPAVNASLGLGDLYLGLFLTSFPGNRGGHSGLECAARATALTFVCGSSPGPNVIQLPRPRWGGEYTAWLFDEDCSPVMVSSPLQLPALPHTPASGGRIHVVPSEEWTFGCSEDRSMWCKKLTVTLTTGEPGDFIVIVPLKDGDFDPRFLRMHAASVASRQVLNASVTAPLTIQLPQPASFQGDHIVLLLSAAGQGVHLSARIVAQSDALTLGSDSIVGSGMYASVIEGTPSFTVKNHSSEDRSDMLVYIPVSLPAADMYTFGGLLYNMGIDMHEQHGWSPDWFQSAQQIFPLLSAAGVYNTYELYTILLECFEAPKYAHIWLFCGNSTERTDCHTSLSSQWSPSASATVGSSARPWSTSTIWMAAKLNTRSRSNVANVYRSSSWSRPFVAFSAAQQCMPPAPPTPPPLQPLPPQPPLLPPQSQPPPSSVQKQHLAVEFLVASLLVIGTLRALWRRKTRRSLRRCTRSFVAGRSTHSNSSEEGDIRVLSHPRSLLHGLLGCTSWAVDDPWNPQFNQHCVAAVRTNIKMLPAPPRPNADMLFSCEAIQSTELTILAPIGHGGFSRVYKADWNGGLVALKIPKSNGTISSTVREAALLRSLRHPHIASFYGIVIAKNECVGIVLELMEGNSLASLLFPQCSRASTGSADNNERSELSSPERSLPSLHARRQLASQIASGLSFLHASGITHRDVKCANVLLDSTHRHAKMTDFGLSRLTRSERKGAALTDPASDVTTDCYGTPRYMAAELLGACANGVVVETPVFCKASDVYAFGTLLFELMHAKVFFGEVGAYAAMNRAAKGHRPSIDLPGHGDLAELIKECWKHDSESRPPMADVLRGIASNRTGKLEAPPSSSLWPNTTFNDAPLAAYSGDQRNDSIFSAKVRDFEVQGDGSLFTAKMGGTAACREIYRLTDGLAPDEGDAFVRYW